MPALTLHYQPIICLASGQVAGCEALLRVDGGSPFRHLQTADHFGTLTRLTDWVANEAIAQLAHWHHYSHHFWVSFNLSGQDLADPELCKRLYRACQTHGTPPRLVHLEVSESCKVGSTEITELGCLREYGFRLALDDAGSAWAGLASLGDFSWDLVKCDRSIVPAAPSDYRATATLQGLAAIENTLGARLLCEGIEQAWQADIVRAAGFEYGQGWLWGKAVPAEEFFDTWLNA